MGNGIITVHTNEKEASLKVKKLLSKKLESAGYQVSSELEEKSQLIVCIGGDGTFLESVHKYNFPNKPFMGINTGHLGFFQELNPNQLDDFIFNYKGGKYAMQTLSTVEATVETETGETYSHTALNEIVVKGKPVSSVHLDISIGGSFIERFSGDGILVATPAGSTAYNYSLGGSIVDPRIKLLQVTPMAPMNTVAYRSFTSSILLPAELSLEVMPEKGKETRILADHLDMSYPDVKCITVEFSEKTVELLRFEGYDFWNKVKSKFL